jgi:hypothetical protein
MERFPRKNFNIHEKMHVAILSKVDYSIHFLVPFLCIDKCTVVLFTCTYYESKNKPIQSTSEIRTMVGFRIQSYGSPGHSISGPFEIQTKMSGFQLASLDRFMDRFVMKKTTV